MRLTVTQYAQALEELGNDSSSDVASITQNFFGLLKRRGELGIAPLVVAQMERNAQKREETLRVKAVTAHQVSPDTRGTIERLAETVFPKRTLQFEYKIDERVIGGVRLETDEVLYDATLVSKLASLKKVLSNA